MPRITTKDIENMRSRGFDPMTIAEAELTLVRSQETEAICRQIEEAFKGTVLGDGIGLREALGLDDYADEETCAAYRAEDEKEDWSKLVDKVEGYSSSPSFFDADGFRFHLPAYMIADLRDDGGLGFIHSLIFFDVLKYDRYTSLSDQQRAAVRSYLIFRRDDPFDDLDRADIQTALDVYWTKESCQN